MVVRGNITFEKLNYIYDTINSIVSDENCYYDEGEIKKLKENKKNKFIKSSNIKD